MNTNHHVKMMELTINYGDWSYDRIALFDDRDITPEQVIKLVREADQNEYFVLLTKEQYKNIFRSLRKENK